MDYLATRAHPQVIKGCAHENCNSNASTTRARVWLASPGILNTCASQGVGESSSRQEWAIRLLQHLGMVIGTATAVLRLAGRLILRISCLGSKSNDDKCHVEQMAPAVFCSSSLSKYWRKLLEAASKSKACARSKAELNC